MPPRLALLIGVIFVYLAFRSDRKRGTPPTGLFWPTLWYLVVASRSIGVWFGIWGIPLPGGSDDPTEGSLIDRSFYALLTVIGLWILSRRRFSWGAAFGRTPWVTVLFVYMGLSIFWSHYPYVSFKRYIKVVGSVVMALVVLTNERPFDSIFTILRRTLYIHLPMSIICTRYFRDIGVSFDYSGTGQSWTGISTSKNTLGQISMLGVIYFVWEVRSRWAEYKWRNQHVLYLLGAIYLLKGPGGSVSMTSVSVCVFALLIFLRIQSLRARPEAVRLFVGFIFYGMVALIALVLTHSVVMFEADSVFGHLITAFGRDITLTDRTFIWHDVYAAASSNPLLGVGFGGFWIGRMVNIPWASKMTWTLGQAHNGYVDTYLQLGWVGGLLLALVLFTTLPRLLASLLDDFDLGCFLITMFLTIIYVNITETTLLRGDHHLWFIMQLVLWTVPAVRAVEEEPPFEDHSEA